MDIRYYGTIVESVDFCCYTISKNIVGKISPFKIVTNSSSQKGLVVFDRETEIKIDCCPFCGEKIELTNVDSMDKDPRIEWKDEKGDLPYVSHISLCCRELSIHILETRAISFKVNSSEGCRMISKVDSKYGYIVLDISFCPFCGTEPMIGPAFCEEKL